MSALYGANSTVVESCSVNCFGLLEAQAIQIFREVAAEAKTLFSSILLAKTVR